ncbi:DUF4430 domain-containing protein [Streptococcus entericus]|uniref:DUF4430 domain-containing protein n=1 Tax=Streptococcus entericus TaxID=155680 RepID=UPI000382770C|nr:DUF4430 domain-containing protein [Streptococcus entericus]
MRKRLSSIFALMAVLSVTGCAAVRLEQEKTTPATSQVSEQMVQLVVKTGETQTEQSVPLKEGETVLDLLKAHHDVEETDGFVTAIDGVKQDEAAKLYWMYKVNDVMADKSAAELTPNAGDVIEFYQEKF